VVSAGTGLGDGELPPKFVSPRSYTPKHRAMATSIMCELDMRFWLERTNAAFAEGSGN